MKRGAPPFANTPFPVPARRPEYQNRIRGAVPSGVLLQSEGVLLAQYYPHRRFTMFANFQVRKSRTAVGFGL